MYDFDNIGEAIRKAQENVLQALNERVMQVSMEGLQGEYITRIFEKGLDSEDSKTGNYSTTPGYFDKSTFVNKGGFKPQGKTGEKKFTTGAKKGQDHRSMYLPGGYKQFKAVQGLISDTVTSELTGSLKVNVQVVNLGSGEYGLGLTSERESKKRKGLEKQFKKKIFAASPNDIKYLSETIIDEIQAIKDELL